MTYKRSSKARAETIRRRTIRRAKRATVPTVADVETWLNLSELR